MNLTGSRYAVLYVAGNISMSKDISSQLLAATSDVFKGILTILPYTRARVFPNTLITAGKVKYNMLIYVDGDINMLTELALYNLPPCRYLVCTTDFYLDTRYEEKKDKIDKRKTGQGKRTPHKN